MVGEGVLRKKAEIFLLFAYCHGGLCLLNLYSFFLHFIFFCHTFIWFDLFEIWYRKTVWKRKPLLMKLWGKKCITFSTLALNQRAEICLLWRDTSEGFWQPVQPLMMPVRPSRLSSQPEDSCLSSFHLKDNERLSSLLLMFFWIAQSIVSSVLCLLGLSGLSWCSSSIDAYTTNSQNQL